MRTLVVVEDNPNFVIVKNNRHQCQDCGRWILTFKRPADSAPRFYWHRGNMGTGSFADPIQWRKCAGSGKLIS